ncbi:MAG TPA: phage tail protein [Symbiobacteriaceae bacterium]|nr:phage tail protein [Symbiobacteriaceae bacterium]
MRLRRFWIGAAVAIAVLCLFAIWGVAAERLVAAAPSPRDTVEMAFSWVLEFRGQQYLFREAVGIGSEHEVVEHRVAGAKGQQVTQKIAGRLKLGDITLKRNLTADLGVYQLRKTAEDGQWNEARSNGTLTLRDGTGQEVAKWELTNAWPFAYSVTSPSAETVMEQITITYEGIRRTE